MKIILIHPELKKYVQPKLPPLGLLSLAAVLEKAGYQVEVLDLNVTPKIYNDINFSEYGMIGITATTPLIKEAWILAKELKKLTKVPVVFGGPHPSALPEESLDNGADIIVRHEGEKTILELADTLQKNGDLKKVNGLVFRENGSTIKTPKRTFLTEEELNGLPFPAYHLLKEVSLYSTPQPVISEKARSLTVVTSRGCPYLCNYCFKGVFGREWRAQSAEYVVKLFKYLVDTFKVEEIGVQDDAFNIDTKRVKAICDGLLREGVKVKWTTAQGLRANSVTLDLFRKMKQTGFFRTGFGIESGNQAIISEHIHKAVKKEDVIAAVKAAKAAGIEPITYFMIGNSGENEKTMQETIDFARELNTDIAHFTITVPFPGTPLYAQIKEEGKFLVTDWSLYGYTKGICYFELGEVKKKLVERMWKKAYRSYYLKPYRIWRMIAKKGALKRLPALFKAALQYLGIRRTA
ncbi:MAG: radical SAM protein [Candidatus Firestonebacteria bacterium]